MKLVQLIRPLFITAIGLHAALLFVPIAPDEPVGVEDIEVSALAAGDSAKIDKTTPAGLDPLPVPDPNVRTGNVRTGSTAITPAKTAPRQATTARTATGRRTAASTTRTTNSNTAAARRQNTSNSSSSNATASNGSNPASSSRRSETGRSSASSGRASSATDSQTFIATSGEQASTSEQNVSDNASASSTQAVNVESPLTVESLLAKVTQELPKDFRAFVSDLNQSLTYSEKLTDDVSSAAAKADWQATIQSQANVGQIEQMPTAEISELTEIDYPIESSLKSEGLTISRCLTPVPESAEIGVLFDSRGEIVGEPELIRSTGYGALNDEIKATVVAYKDFPGDRISKAYTFEVEVDYDADACVSLADLKGEKPLSADR